jgi:hypothetical protein
VGAVGIEIASLTSKSFIGNGVEPPLKSNWCLLEPKRSRSSRKSEKVRPSTYFGVYQDCSLETLANVPSNLVIVIVNGSAYDFARSLKMLSVTCSPNKMDQKDELRK